MPVSPESRFLWYRLFHHKLYNQSLLSRFDNGLTSSQCKFCSANIEDLQHLFVRCPMKWRINKKNISETTFITRYILPALQPLFDNQERNIRFEFSSTDLADNHKRSPGFNGCLGCIITIFQHQTDDGANVEFGEVKQQSMAGNHYLVNWDLLRLAVFGKNAIDGNKLSGNLAIHVIGEFRVGKKARTSPFIGSNYMLMDCTLFPEIKVAVTCRNYI
ncbi:hypothetical protein G6F17_013062 [Rhizopus arrhizus]|nr:hypothetical protein G6F17_013062 [Rhizopus arrhizus]